MNQQARIHLQEFNPPAGPAAATALFTVFVWALSFPLTKIALADLAPLPLAAARFAIASLLIGGWLLWKRPPLPNGTDGVRFLLCGLIGIAVYNALLNSGQRTVSASRPVRPSRRFSHRSARSAGARSREGPGAST